MEPEHWSHTSMLRRALDKDDVVPGLARSRRLLRLVFKLPVGTCEPTQAVQRLRTRLRLLLSMISVGMLAASSCPSPPVMALRARALAGVGRAGP